MRCPATYRSRVRVVLVFKLEEEYRKHQDFQDFRFKTSYVEISQILIYFANSLTKCSTEIAFSKRTFLVRSSLFLKQKTIFLSVRL